jgi:hypothetical protein
MLHNSIDDELYLSSPEIHCKIFEPAVSKCFDVKLIGQVEWYLQVYIKQHANFSISLDQYYYAALLLS